MVCLCEWQREERARRDENEEHAASPSPSTYPKTLRCRQLPMCDCVLSTLHTQLLPSCPHNTLEEYRVICAVHTRWRQQYCSNEDYYREGRRRAITERVGDERSFELMLSLPPTTTDNKAPWTTNNYHGADAEAVASYQVVPSAAERTSTTYYFSSWYLAERGEKILIDSSSLEDSPKRF